MKIKKGDRVRVLMGKDRHKEGVVMRALPQEGMVFVDGVNRVRKHQRATRATMQGGVIDKEMPMPVSKVAIICPTCGPTRIGYAFDPGPDGAIDRNSKRRICKKCKGDL